MRSFFLFFLFYRRFLINILIFVGEKCGNSLTEFEGMDREETSSVKGTGVGCIFDVCVRCAIRFKFEWMCHCFRMLVHIVTRVLD